MSPGNLKIWYESPASAWVEALPLGNGTLGAMVFGWIEEECFQLNNDTLWSGLPRDRTNPSALELLPSVQKLVLDGKIPEAEGVIEEYMGCPRTESYQPMGYLYLALDHGKDVTHYRRELDLETATCKVEYDVAGGAHVTREAFISYPDKVMVVKITAEGGNPLKLEASMDTEHERSCTIQQKDDGGDYLVLESRVPSHVAPNYEITHGKDPVTYENGKGMTFQIHLKILNCDGMVAIEGDAIAISNARSIELLIASGTSFSGFNVDPSNQPVRLEDRAQEIMSGMGDVSYQGLKSRHIKDYQELFSRVTLDLGTSENMALPTGNRISQIKVSKQARKMDDPVFKWFMQAASSIEYDRAEENKIQEGFDDPQLIVLYFQFGRYLLISSSRPGSQPANLQGIWNDKMRPPWSSNYTVNINLEMNYWLAETANLAECIEPLTRMITELSEEGSKIARTYYGCNGWTCNHNSDLWRTAGPVYGWPGYMWWPMGAGWLCRHLYERYSFSRDTGFLEIVYPVMKGAAVFFIDWLVKDPAGEYLITVPSTSPENRYISENGYDAAVSTMTTMDMSIIWDTFTNCIKASELLGVDADFRENLIRARERLRPYRISKRNKGCLQEWDEDYKEKDPGHRHMSHLYGWHPGNQILLHEDEELAGAIKKSLERRLAWGGGGTGWSCAWLISHWARMEDAEGAYNQLMVLLRRSTYPNLFDAHPPFQIDGNFGGVAGIVEMLMQSHGGEKGTEFVEIGILPALPKCWKHGRIAGIRARGDYEVSIEWKKGRLVQAEIKSGTGGRLRVRVQGKINIHSDSTLEPRQIADGLHEIITEPGKVYMISGAGESK